MGSNPTLSAIPRISVAIPAYNEADYLPALLESIAVASGNYTHGADAVEVIVADNGSTDATAEIACAHGCKVVYAPKRAIAAARNAAAEATTGQIVAFIDADSTIHPDTFNAIERTLSDRVVVAATGVRMSRYSAGIRLSFAFVWLMLRLARVDTGVVFCRREDWAAVGGYDESHRYAEDVSFLWALKRLGRTRGQRFTRAKGVPAVTSARKFDRYGDWHWFTLMPKTAFYLLFDRAGAERFVDHYWYRRDQ